MNPAREHLAGLETAKEHLDSITNWGGADSLSKLIALAKAAPQAEPVAWMLADAVGGSMLEFQRDLLLEDQCRYGGSIEPLYPRPAPDAELIELLERINDVLTDKGQYKLSQELSDKLATLSNV